MTLESPKIRLFVAIFPPKEVQERLAKTAGTLAENLPTKAVAWTAPEQIHLTLHFLGGVEPANISGYEVAISQTCKTGRQFIIRAKGLGCFPGPRRPRIIWAGLRGEIEILESLRKQMEPEFVALGYRPEDRPFHPHLTIGRVKDASVRDQRSLAKALERHEQTDFGEWIVDRIDLMQSVLGPAGSRYSLIKSFELPKT